MKNNCSVCITLYAYPLSSTKYTYYTILYYYTYDSDVKKNPISNNNLVVQAQQVIMESVLKGWRGIQRCTKFTVV